MIFLTRWGIQWFEYAVDTEEVVHSRQGDHLEQEKDDMALAAMKAIVLACHVTGSWEKEWRRKT